ncbi:MAG: hypothetical protein MMC33_006504 [Icmadophila ericetorum]|nr:hypothetical protein [Icmadophila ericetorum]
MPTPPTSIVTEVQHTEARNRDGGVSGGYRERTQGHTRGSNAGRGPRRGGQRGRGRGDGFGSLPLRTTLTSSVAPAPSIKPHIDPGESPGKGPAQDTSIDTSKGGIVADDVEAETESPFVIFTDDPVKRYEDFVEEDYAQSQKDLGINFEKQEIYDDTMLLLRYNCPDGDCEQALYGWPSLHHHVKSVHHKVMCDLCTRNKKVFTHEHELFAPKELQKHESEGDNTPGAADQSGFRGHPKCEFCRKRFYGDDELYLHLRDAHERCFICDRRNEGREAIYFQNFAELQQHFRDDHFPCLDPKCSEEKFVVFGSELDLQHHHLEKHGGTLSKDERRNARQVNISTFDYRQPHQESRGRGRGRGRDPNTEALPPSTAQPMSRAELAFQRQMAIQIAQSVQPRTFGGQLTQTVPNMRVPARNADQAANNAARNYVANNPFPPLENANPRISAPSSPQLQAAITPQEQARRLRHNAVMERASNMLRDDQFKISDFRSRVSSYRTSAITATQLIDSFFLLFDVPSADLGKLIKELADIYENETKRSDLLKAWNDWRAINEDYPSLPGPSGILSSTSTGTSSGRRILKLKSSTAQSSQSAVNRHQSWGGAASSSNPFPPMPASSVNRAGPGKVAPVPWTSSSAAASSRGPPPSRPVPLSTASAASRSKATASAAPSSEAFPSLPPAPKPNTTMFGIHRGAVNWDSGRSKTPQQNPWGGSSSKAGSAEASAQASEAEEGNGNGNGNGEVGGGRKKGNKGKKQILFQIG